MNVVYKHNTLFDFFGVLSKHHKFISYLLGFYLAFAQNLLKYALFYSYYMHAFSFWNIPWLKLLLFWLKEWLAPAKTKIEYSRQRWLHVLSANVKYSCPMPCKTANQNVNSLSLHNSSDWQITHNLLILSHEYTLKAIIKVEITEVSGVEKTVFDISMPILGTLIWVY